MELLNRLKLGLPHDPAHPALVVYPKKRVSGCGRDTCTLCSPHLFTIGKDGNNPCSPTGDWVKKIWYTEIVEYYSASKRKRSGGWKGGRRGKKRVKKKTRAAVECLPSYRPGPEF